MLLSRHHNAGISWQNWQTYSLKSCHNSYIFNGNNKVKIWFRRKLRWDWILVMLATIRSRTFCLLVCCLGTFKGRGMRERQRVRYHLQEQDLSGWIMNQWKAFVNTVMTNLLILMSIQQMFAKPVTTDCLQWLQFYKCLDFVVSEWDVCYYLLFPFPCVVAFPVVCLFSLCGSRTRFCCGLPSLLVMVDMQYRVTWYSRGRFV
jgi:hypothetical protein